MNFSDLTVVILTLNEEDRIVRCLESLPAGARVVIFDSFSTDATGARARDTWERLDRPLGDFAFVARPWLGFTEMRNATLRWVATPWVLWLDADEWITPELAAELEKLPEDAAVCYRIPRLTWFLGRAIRHGGWYPDYKRRLARTGQCEWRRGRHDTDVHEDLHPLPADAPIGTLRGQLGHETFRDLAEQAATNDRYSTLLAEGLVRKWRAEKRREPSDAYIALKAAVKFVENYVWKLGFLDGRPGYLIARGSAESLALRLRKARARLITGL